MSRVPVLTLENAPEAARPFLQTALNNSGYIPNLLGVLANAPAALETYLTVSGLNAKASLGLPEREVVQLVAATTHGCDFCVAGHTAVARNKARLPEPVIEALRARGVKLQDTIETYSPVAARSPTNSSKPSAPLVSTRPRPWK